MAVDKVLYELLKGYVSNRAYPGTLPDLASQTYPCITYGQIAHPMHTIVNTGSPTFQVDIWGTTYSSVVELAETIRVGIDRKKDVVLTYPIRVTVLDFLMLPFEDDTKLWHGVMDVQLFYKEV